MCWVPLVRLVGVGIAPGLWWSWFVVVVVVERCALATFWRGVGVVGVLWGAVPSPRRVCDVWFCLVWGHSRVFIEQVDALWV